jgi:hypothetical protein
MLPLSDSWIPLGGCSGYRLLTLPHTSPHKRDHASALNPKQHRLFFSERLLRSASSTTSSLTIFRASVDFVYPSLSISGYDLGIGSVVSPPSTCIARTFHLNSFISEVAVQGHRIVSPRRFCGNNGYKWFHPTLIYFF